MARPMVTKMSLKPPMKRSCSSSGEAGNSGGSLAVSSARRRSACSAVIMPRSTPFAKISLAIIDTGPLELSKPDQACRKQLMQSCLDDWRPALPNLDRLEGMNQHDDVERQIVANMQRQYQLEQEHDRDGGDNRKLLRQQKAADHRKVIGDRIDDAVAEVIQRDRAGAVAVDDPVGILDQFPAAFQQHGNDQAALPGEAREGEEGRAV